MDDIIKEMNKLSLEKGDILVVKLPVMVTSDLYKKSKELLEKHIPSYIKTLIISKDVDIGIIKNRTGKYWDLFRIE